MALIGRPKLVVLINPLSGVDPINKRKLINTILKYTEGRSLVLSTKDVEVAQLIGHKVGVLTQGGLAAIGSVAEILKNHCQGFNIELRVDTDSLEKQTSGFSIKGGDYVESLNQGTQLLKKIQEGLEEMKEMVAYEDLATQFSPEGDLAMQFEHIEAGNSFSFQQFTNMVLILNLAMCVKWKLQELLPALAVEVTSIAGDLVRFEVYPERKERFNEAHFSGAVQEVIQGMPVAYFSFGSIGLEEIFAKLSAEKSSSKLFLSR